MRPYEVMVIFDAGAEPPAIQAVVDRTLETIRTTAAIPAPSTAGAGAPSPTR